MVVAPERGARRPRQRLDALDLQVAVALIEGGASPAWAAAVPLVFASPGRVCAAAICAKQKAANTSANARAEIGI
jgi:hypothetical protein